MGTESYKMDLHIHTPASKCYKGSKNDEEYFEILRYAHKQNLDIIAFTDHNSIAGYNRILQLKEELINKRKYLSEYESSISQLGNVIRECDDKLALFDDIYIIPGVEITLNPGVHILVLSSHEEIEELSNLLDYVGYTEEKRGADSDVAINMDIKNFLTYEKLKKFIVIAPHIDSNKGIYNSLSGQYRAEIMHSPSICGFSCNATSQKEKVMHLFEKDPNYKRNFLPAFVNCSDAHEVNEVGTKYSYIKLEKLSFDEIKKVFETPDNRISDTSDERLEKDLYSLIDVENPVLISDDALVNELDLAHYFCACLNDGIGCIIMGVDETKKIRGVKKDEEEIKTIIRGALKKITSQYWQLRYIIKIEGLGNGSNIAIVYLDWRINSLWFMEKEKEVYIIENNIPIIATISQIEDIVQTNTLCEISLLEEKNTQTVMNIGSELLTVTNLVEKHKLLQEIMQDAIPLLSVYKIESNNATTIEESNNRVFFEDFGLTKGNLFYVCANAIRLDNAILRFSCPIADVPEKCLDVWDTAETSIDNIVISQYGGTHILKSDYKIIGYNTDYVILSPKEENDMIADLVLAWLKSSLFTWYIYKRRNTTNIYIPEVLREVVVPYHILKEKSIELEKNVQAILSIENKFITNYVKDDICKKCSKDEKCKVCMVEERIDVENKEVEQCMREIDQIIFDLFEVDEDMVDLIQQDLRAANIYDII